MEGTSDWQKAIGTGGKRRGENGAKIAEARKPSWFRGTAGGKSSKAAASPVVFGVGGLNSGRVSGRVPGNLVLVVFRKLGSPNI